MQENDPQGEMSALSPMGQTAQAVLKREAVLSIQAIINAMDDAGCGTCTARMIARRELRKFKEAQNG